MSLAKGDMDLVWIDINCDVGEGIGNEEALFPLISSCSIACGGHAGNTQSMREVVRLAKKFGVKAGAHPSYPDRANFGRVSLSLPAKDLQATVLEQISSLEDILKTEQLPLHHIKAHGALYNDLADNAELTGTYLEAIGRWKEVPLYAPSDSVFARESVRKGFKVRREAFGDRRYTEVLRLAPRSQERAVIQDPEQVLKQVCSMALEGRVQTITRSWKPISAETYCIHGDTPSALEILTYLAGELPKHGIHIKK